MPIVDQDASGVGLLLAARSGDIEIVRSLVRQGAELEQRDILGDNGLLKAARYGHAQVVELLLMAGADVNAYDNNGWTALHTSIANGREEVVFALLSGYMYHQSVSINIEATNSNGDTPLHMAAFHGREWAVGILLRLGVNRGATNDRGERPFEVARHNTVRAMIGPSTGSPNQDEERHAYGFEEGEGYVPRNIPTNATFGNRPIGGGNGPENAETGAGVVEGVGRRSFDSTPSSKATNWGVHGVLNQLEEHTLPSVEQESVKNGDNERFDRLLDGSRLESSHVSTETEQGFASLQKRGSDSSFEEASSEGELSLDSRMAQHYLAEENIDCGVGGH